MAPTYIALGHSWLDTLFRRRGCCSRARPETRSITISAATLQLESRSLRRWIAFSDAACALLSLRSVGRIFAVICASSARVQSFAGVGPYAATADGSNASALRALLHRFSGCLARNRRCMREISCGCYCCP
jgi:hypothetical protein